MDNKKINITSGHMISKEVFFEIIHHLNTNMSIGEAYDAKVIAHYVCLILKRIMIYDTLNGLDPKHIEILSKIKQYLLIFKDEEE